MTGYEAFEQGAALPGPVGARGRIRVTGDDRKRLLHAMTTNHIEGMADGDSLYAFFLNAQGRILADALIYCGSDFLLVDVEPEQREKLYGHIDRYIIADDVTLEDVSDSTAEIAVEGPAAAKLEPQGLRLNQSASGVAGWRVIVPIDEKPALMERLRAEGCVDASAEEIRTVRLEHGRPRYGEEFSDANLAQETGLTHALHSNKGCYLGQEIVERVRSRGHVNKRLAGLRIDGAGVPERGEKVMLAGREAGEIAAAAYSARLGSVVALAWLRGEAPRGAAGLSVAGVAAQLVEHVQ